MGEVGERGTALAIDGATVNCVSPRLTGPKCNPCGFVSGKPIVQGTMILSTLPTDSSCLEALGNFGNQRLRGVSKRTMLLVGLAVRGGAGHVQHE